MIQKGWQMILNGASQMDVYRYWKMNNVERSTKLSRRNKHARSYGVCESTANRIFHDPFYYGILEQGRNYVDLRVVTPNFKPMVTEEEFDQVQKMFRKDRDSIQSSCYENQKATHGKYFLPFRHLIKCSVCSHYLIPARNRGHSGTYYLNYRCHNKACTRPKNRVHCRETRAPRSENTKNKERSTTSRKSTPSSTKSRQKPSKTSSKRTWRICKMML